MENKNITVDTLIGDLYKNNGLLSTENNLEKHINNINKNYNDNNFNLNNFNENRLNGFNEDITNTRSYFYYFFIFIVFIIFFLFIFYFRNNIKNYFTKSFNTLFTEKQNEIPELKQIKKYIQNEKYKTKEIKKRKVPKKSFKDLEDNISNKLRYNKNKFADYDGFCYIGYDNGQRECTEIDKGDVCLSGEIFPSQEICMMPKLRE